jgi:hypothetical protein
VVADAVLLVAGVLLVVRTGGPQRGGPLDNQAVTATGIRQHPGDLIGYGVPVAFNDGDTPVKLKSARLVNPTPGMRIVHTYAPHLIATSRASPSVRRGRRTSSATSEAWPG